MSDKDVDEKLQKAISEAIDRWADKRLSQLGRWSLGVIGVAALWVLMHAFLKIEGFLK